MFASLPAPSPSVPSLGARARAIASSAFTILRDPGRLDQVLVFAQAVNAGALARAADRFANDPAGRRLFEEKPRIDRTHVDFEALRALPDGTLGREYTRFLDANGIGPEPFEQLPDVGDVRVAWIMLRMRQTHDLWHVLTGYAPDVRGEVLLQAFNYAQAGAPSAFLIAFLGAFRWVRSADGMRDLRAAYRRGKETAFLPTFRWEDHWETPLSELRAMLRCPA